MREGVGVEEEESEQEKAAAGKRGGTAVASVSLVHSVIYVCGKCGMLEHSHRVLAGGGDIGPQRYRSR